MDATEKTLLEFAKKLQTSANKQRRFPDPADDPVGFVDALGVTPWSKTGFGGADKITKIIQGVFKSKRRFTVVESGNGVGKSITAAAVVCTWLAKYEDAAVVTIAPTAAQVNNILWRNIRQMHRTADGILPGEVLETPVWKIAPQRYGVGLSPKRATAEDLQSLYGYHSPNLLVILDEAPGLPRLLWEAVQRLVTAENNKILALGNPLEQAGPFWEACNDESWNHIQISCLGHPNVVMNKTAIEGATGWAWVNERVKEHCTQAAAGDPGSFKWGRQHYQPNGVFQSMVLGRAPTESADQLIPLNWVTGAMEWIADPGRDEPIVLGLDPSRVAHGDASALVARQGARVLWVKRRRPRTNDPTGELSGWVKEEYQKLGAGRAYVEEPGIGGGIVDRLRNLGVSVFPVIPAGGASTRQWGNKRAECWWKLRDALQGGAVSLPQDDLLMADLTAPKFHHDGQGKIMIEVKENIRSRLGRSPDSGDALAITFALASTRAVAGENNKQKTPLPSRWSVGVKSKGRGRWKGR